MTPAPRISNCTRLAAVQQGAIAFLTAICLAASACGGAEVVLMDGRTLEGEVRAWQDDRLDVASEGGTTALKAEEILQVRFAPPRDEPPPKQTVELIDGSVLPVEVYTVVEGKATLKMASVAEEIVVDTQLIAAVHLQPPSPQIAAQWNEIRESEEAGDLIVIRKEEAVDHLAGRLGDVTETHVMFYVDGDEYPVEREKVDGLVYYHAQAEQFPDPLSVVHGRQGLRLALAAATLSGDVLAARTTSGVAFSLPAARVMSVDFSAGKLMYLGELSPRSVETTPLVAFPASASVLSRLGGPIVDRGFFSPTAELRYPQHKEGRITGWQLKGHARSIGLRSKSRVVYSLPEGFRRLKAIAGIDGTLGGRGNVHLALYGDDRLLWEHAIDGGDAPTAIDLDVAGVRRLTIAVDYGADGDAADRLYLCDARITK
jgi:hypothetical protein